ncbi:MAG: type II toxin-antitoxin system PemK/MazF family toxin [Planctomycetota bacterium]|nr:type II toxin-antitoxin system PemK/MazF family toxin [Planctomycetota bacterium]
MPTYPIPRRGEIWLVSLDPTVGHEVQKTRPAIVVTDDIYNEHNWVVLIMPLTSRDKAEYDQVLIDPPDGGLSNPSVTLPDQIRAIDRQRLVTRLGSLTEATMQKVDHSLRVVLSL